MDLTIDSNLRIKNHNKPFILKTPVVKIPFGIEDYYGSHLLKLELPKDKQFTALILAIEDKFKDDLGITNLKSSIISSKHRNFGDLLVTKIKQNQIKVDKIGENGRNYGVMKDIKKGTKAVATLLFDTLWENDDESYTYKIKLIELALL